MSDNSTLALDGEHLSPKSIAQFLADSKMQILIAKSAKNRVAKSREFLEKNFDHKVIYGINTGFGPMASHIIGKSQLRELQYNLVRSHACGAGNPIDGRFVLAAMVARLNTFLKGYSGVSQSLIERLTRYINERIVPVVPEHGAVGTSGDLVQLAHIALALIGEGDVMWRGKQVPAINALKSLHLAPYKLQPKEGLALINGTAVMTGVGSVTLTSAKHLLELSIQAGALAMELIRGFDDGLSEELHATRSHAGQVVVARMMRTMLKTSQLLRKRGLFQERAKVTDDVYVIPETVQEIYSLRCIPQIVGPVWQELEATRKVLETELNAATDNPLIDVKHKAFLHGGNFHGDYISFAMDKMKIGLVKLTMLLERQTNFFLNKNVNQAFPPFLNLKKPGLTLALQGLQFVATSTTAQSQTLAFPQYVHSIPTNGDNQDIVSMGTDSALLAHKVLENAYVVLAIELVTLAQAVDVLRVREKLSRTTGKLYDFTRKYIDTVRDDVSMSKALNTFVEALKIHSNT